MGTNYYVKNSLNPETDFLHIGKSSGGWFFMLHVVPEMGLNDLPDWVNYFEGREILDSGGNRIFTDEMVNIISKRSGDVVTPEPGNFSRYDGFASMLQRNGAIYVKDKRLIRRKFIAPCVGHGAGTWDLVIGNFS